MNKKIFSLIGISVASLFYAQDVSAIRNTLDVYSGYTPPTGTSRYMSMAGSMGALGGDLSTIESNPAGVGVAIINEINATLGVTNYTNTSTLGSGSLDQTFKKTNLTQAGALVVFEPFDSKWKFVNIGLNYKYRDLDSYIRTPENHSISDAVSYTNSTGQNVQDELLYDGHAYNRVGRSSVLSFAVGGNYDNQWYLGGALNFYSADLEQGDFFRLMMKSNGDTAIYEKQDTPYQESSNGVSISAGVIRKLDGGLRLGLSLQSPTWWNINRSYNHYYLDNNAIVSDVYDSSRRLSSPTKVGLSAAYVPNKNFAINVDYTLGVSKPKYTSDLDNEVTTQLNEFFRKVYKNQSEVKVGAEYRYQGFRLRGGYAYQSNPFSNASLGVISNNGSGIEDKSYNDLYAGSVRTLAAGLGYDFKSFYVDLAYQNVTSNYSNPFFGGRYAVESANGLGLPVPDIDGLDNGNASIVSKVKHNRSNLLLTLGLRF